MLCASRVLTRQKKRMKAIMLKIIRGTCSTVIKDNGTAVLVPANSRRQSDLLVCQSILISAIDGENEVYKSEQLSLTFELLEGPRPTTIMPRY